MKDTFIHPWTPADRGTAHTLLVGAAQQRIGPQELGDEATYSHELILRSVTDKQRGSGLSAAHMMVVGSFLVTWMAGLDLTSTDVSAWDRTRCLDLLGQARRSAVWGRTQPDGPNVGTVAAGSMGTLLAMSHPDRARGDRGTAGRISMAMDWIDGAAPASAAEFVEITMQLVSTLINWHVTPERFFEALDLELLHGAGR